MRCVIVNISMLLLTFHLYKCRIYKLCIVYSYFSIQAQCGKTNLVEAENFKHVLITETFLIAMIHQASSYEACNRTRTPPHIN